MYHEDNPVKRKARQADIHLKNHRKVYSTMKSIPYYAEKTVLVLPERRPSCKKISNQNIGGHRYRFDRLGFIDVSISSDDLSVSSTSECDLSPGRHAFYLVIHMKPFVFIKLFLRSWYVFCLVILTSSTKFDVNQLFIVRKGMNQDEDFITPSRMSTNINSNINGDEKNPFTESCEITDTVCDSIQNVRFKKYEVNLQSIEDDDDTKTLEEIYNEHKPNHPNSSLKRFKDEPDERVDESETLEGSIEYLIQECDNSLL